MNVTLASQPAHEVTADALVIGHYRGDAPSESWRQVDGATGGKLTQLFEEAEITGQAGELTQILAPSGMKVSRIVVLGLGERAKFDAGGAFRSTAAAAKSLATKARRRVAFYVNDGWSEEHVEAGICGAMVGCVGQDLYRAEKKLIPFTELHWSGASASAVQNGWIQAEGVNLARLLVNEPAGEVFPESFAVRAGQIAREVGLDCEIWDESRLERERCGALLAVGRASSRPPRLVILRHDGGPAGGPLLALVGKGVTFDSGGLSIKDNENMKTMKCDMAGAAAVLAAMQAIARLRLPIQVIGLCGLVENMVSGDSFKLGDVLHARSGKTIEVLNTDAEGRLVLADVLNVALERGATQIVDLATLTGACMVALGRDVVGLMSNDQSWCDTVLRVAQACGEPAWQLPMFPEYAEHIKSAVADIKNVGDGRWGGAITAGKFLEEFVDGRPWVHCDIAGPAFLDSPKPWLDAGGSGVFVRTLIELARRLARSP